MESPLTGKNDTTLLYTLNPVEVSQKWKNSLGIDIGGAFRSLPIIEFWRCNDTGFCWYCPPEAAGGKALYEQLEVFDWYYMAEKWEFSATLNLLNNGSAVLEVGVGEGHFLQAARRSGHDIQGVELNPKGAERARALGFVVHGCQLHELFERTSDRFSAIVSFQVLEHVPDPRRFLEGMISLLRPGGKLVISVPNGAVMRRVDPNNQNLLNQPPHHMSHWDEHVFRALEKILPVRVGSVHREPLASYHVSWMVNGYLRGILSPLGKTAPRLLVNRYSTLPLQWLLRAGVRRLLPGHTLLVELVYQPN